MKHISKLACRLTALYLGIMLLLGPAASAVYAADITVSIQLAQNGTDEAGIPVSGLRVTGVDAPVPGQSFDQSATVTSAEGIQWEIPVMWLDGTGMPAEGNAGAGPCFPVLVFSLPDGHYAADSAGTFQVVLDVSLSQLFGEEVLTVWIEDSEITLIFPGSVSLQLEDVSAGYAVYEEAGWAEDMFLEDLASSVGDELYDILAQLRAFLIENEFLEYEDLPDLLDLLDDYVEDDQDRDGGQSDQNTDARKADNAEEAEDTAEEAGDQTPLAPAREEKTDESSPEPQKEEEKEEDPAPGDPLKRLVDIYCAQTAVNKLGVDQLKTLVDLIVNRLQPQAVNLLTKSFPAFQKAAGNNELGKEIGLYIYFQHGDQVEKDGVTVLPEHQNAPSEVLAYVRHEQSRYEDKTIHFRYFIGVDAAEFSRINEQGNAVLNLSDRHTAANLDNTIVHEMLHAFNDDYNRVGMSGAVDPADLFYKEGLSEEEFAKHKAEVLKKYNETKFPTWFREGLASSVENVYQFRYNHFQLFRYDRASKSLMPSYSRLKMLESYLTVNFTVNAVTQKLTFDLEDAGSNEGNIRPEINVNPAKYVTGYLACLYLGELSAMKVNKNYTYDDEKNNAMYLTGINSIMERLHNGETLDAVIRDISDGRYQDTNEYEKKFIKGSSTGTGDDEVWHGDSDSIRFCVNFLSYLQEIDGISSFKNYANGSILQPFMTDYETPLDSTKEASSELFKIIEKNSLTESTVKNEDTLKDGGRSRSGTETPAAKNAAGSTNSANSGETVTPLQLAAKDSAESLPEEDPAEPHPEETDAEDTGEAAAAEMTGAASEETGAAAEETGAASEETGTAAEMTDAAAEMTDAAAEMTGAAAEETGASAGADQVPAGGMTAAESEAAPEEPAVTEKTTIAKETETAEDTPAAGNTAA